MKTFQKTVVLAVLSTAFMTGSALADHHKQSSFSYDHVTAGYTSINMDELDATASGFTVELNKRIMDSNFYLDLAYTKLSADVDVMMVGGGNQTFDVDTDYQEYSIGYFYSVNEKLDLNLEAGIVGGNAEVANHTSNNKGYRVGTAVRYMVMPKLEMSLSADLVKLKDFDDTTSEFGLGAKYKITDNFDAVTEISTADSDFGWMIGASYRW